MVRTITGLTRRKKPQPPIVRVSSAARWLICAKDQPLGVPIERLAQITRAHPEKPDGKIFPTLSLILEFLSLGNHGNFKIGLNVREV